RGDLDEALRIRREEELPVYERLGDVRSRGVVMGRIAYILLLKGNVKAARDLQEERLEINRGLADADGIAAALWGLAQLAIQEKKVDDAVPRISEAYDIFVRLGRADGIALVGGAFGQFLAVGGEREKALTVLELSVEMYGKLGQRADAQQIDQLIRSLNLR